MNPLRTRLVAAAVGVGLVIAAPTAAWAGPRRPVSTAPTGSTEDSTDARLSIEDLRARCIAAIDVRLPALAAARTAVSGNEHVTDDHRAALLADIDETAARLRELADLIKADTGLATMKEHCRSIFDDNRVFALVLPRVRLVVGADTATDAAAKLGDVAARLADAIAKADAAGQDVGQAKLDLDAMQAAIASGVASAESVAPGVLGLTPADWNADHEVLTPARQTLRSARADLKAARDLALKIRNELKPPAVAPET
ncbi:MAG TPA: hypothetical protein VJS45_09755 [Acidimicrobiia bacterium]|jgi:hypothetical protein|nr:hypothetical protein [Acidimicrobiia bacterium]